jgi:hypothetical protein
MKIMINRPRKLLMLAIIAACVLPAAAAQAHCCRSTYAEPQPLYHYHATHHPYYVVHQEPVYDVKLTQNVFAPQYRLRRYPYARCIDGCASSAPVVVDRRVVVEGGNALPAGGDERTIGADAEVTILGPDRMNIRLFRKGSGKIINVPAD